MKRGVALAHLLAATYKTENKYKKLLFILYLRADPDKLTRTPGTSK